MNEGDLADAALQRMPTYRRTDFPANRMCRRCQFPNDRPQYAVCSDCAEEIAAESTQDTPDDR